MEKQEDNFYEAPKAELIDGEITITGGVELASIWSRLAASILDTFIAFVVFFITIYFFNLSESWIIEDDSLLSDLAKAVVFLTFWMIFNFHLMKTRGQSIGKMALRIQVVDTDSGNIPKVGQSIGVRFVVPQIISTVLVIFAFIDAAFIFRKDKRCIHDMMAKTKVVKYQKPEV